MDETTRRLIKAALLDCDPSPNLLRAQQDYINAHPPTPSPALTPEQEARVRELTKAEKFMSNQDVLRRLDVLESMCALSPPDTLTELRAAALQWRAAHLGITKVVGPAEADERLARAVDAERTRKL